MKIQTIPLNVSFCSKIIDAHTHIGFHDNQLLTKTDLDTFTKSKLPNNDTVVKMLVSDIDVLHGKKSEYEGNKQAFNLFKDDRSYDLFVSCNPMEGNVNQIKKLFNETKGKFVGLKFHPEIQCLAPSDKKYEPYLDFANEHKIPCLFHSQVNLTRHGTLSKRVNELSDPEIIYETAKKYKNAPFIMAHMGAGWNEAHDKAINVLLESVKNNDANLYADISWVDIGLEWERRTEKEHIIKAINALKHYGQENPDKGDQSFRILFGSDAPLSRFKPDENAIALTHYTNFIQDIKNAIKKDFNLKNNAKKIIEDLFYNNAKKLYLLHRF